MVPLMILKLLNSRASLLQSFTLHLTLHLATKDPHAPTRPTPTKLAEMESTDISWRKA